jgi:hypothetical protein
MKDPNDISMEDIAAALGDDPWGENRRERRHCHFCGERYLLENLKDCAGCKEDTCYQCGKWPENPATGESECVCNACLEYRAGWWNGGIAPKVLSGGFTSERPAQ